MSDTLPEAADDPVLADALLAAETMLGRLGRAAAAVLAVPAARILVPQAAVVAARPEPVPVPADAIPSRGPEEPPARTTDGQVVPPLPQPSSAPPYSPPAAFEEPKRGDAPYNAALPPRPATVVQSASPVRMMPPMAPVMGPAMPPVAASLFMLPEVIPVPATMAHPPPIQAAMRLPTAPLAPARAAAAPPPRETHEGPPGGDVFLDGVRVGRWMGQHLAGAAVRPQSGASGFDPRLSPGFPGTLQGPWGWGG